MFSETTCHFAKKSFLHFSLVVLPCLFFILLLSSNYATPSEKKVVSDKNFYGGKTILLQFDPQDKEYKLLEKALVFYDDNGILRKSIYLVGKEKSDKSGIIRQIEDYDKYGNKLFYEVYYSEKMASQKGVTHLIEILDESGETVSIKYYRGKILINQSSPGDESIYPFYRISYIASQYSMFKNKSQGKNHYVIDTSGAMRARSFVRYLNQVKPLDETDKKFLDYWGKVIPQAQKIIPLYSKKILVEEEGNTYWVLFQDELFKPLKNNQWMTIYYHIGQANDRMMLMVTRFDDKPDSDTDKDNNSY